MKEIHLNHGLITIVDDEDYDQLIEFTWYAAKGRRGEFYAMTSNKRVDGKRLKPNLIAMHRMIMGFPEGLQVDHINHSTLDNRKENLRICTSRQNQFNKSRSLTKKGESQFMGTYFNGYSWTASIGVDWKKIHIGSYKTEEQAAKAYDAAAISYFGEFANLNFK